ncbi:hypothetical protein J2Z65_000534 [Paenibacillus aceris]|uniref:Uncharacterized protein n=1 Tax=Paenibacillus aceris TaxID=869555 RepID=A0ABS4HS46_9BACL|nr:hypothetical protein [Paenibacillus aceris]
MSPRAMHKMMKPAKQKKPPRRALGTRSKRFSHGLNYCLKVVSNRLTVSPNSFVKVS